VPPDPPRGGSKKYSKVPVFVQIESEPPNRVGEAFLAGGLVVIPPQVIGHGLGQGARREAFLLVEWARRQRIRDLEKLG
jgi:hypothetical protein